VEGCSATVVFVDLADLISDFLAQKILIDAQKDVRLSDFYSNISIYTKIIFFY